MANKEKIYLRIKNFRSFEDITLEFRPLNFIFGPNGAGKSSFIKAIKFFSHNLFNLDDTLFFEGLKAPTHRYKLDKDTDLISFKEIVRNNDVKKKIVFEVIIRNTEISYNHLNNFLGNIYLGKLRIQENSEYEKIENEITDVSVIFEMFNYDRTKRERIKITITDLIGNYSFSFIPDSANPENNNTFERTISMPNEKDPKGFIKSFLENISTMPFIQHNSEYEKYSLKNDSDMILADLSLTNKRNSQTRSDKETTHLYIETLKIYYKLFFAIPSIVKKIFYKPLHLPALREVPKSIYTLNEGRFPENEYYGILYAFDKDSGIVEYKTDWDNYNKEIAFRDFEKTRIFHEPVVSFTDLINRTLSNLGLARKIIIKKENRIGYLNYISFEDGTEINISGASSGLLQLLPIIYRSAKFELDARRGENNVVKLIEQPELHLHPKLQAELAKFFTSRDILDNNLIIETHSEHLIRNIQVLIAQADKELGHENLKQKVGVYYFSKDKKTGISNIKEMELEDNGFFKEPWPDGFFDDSYNLTKELLRANKN